MNKEALISELIGEMYPRVVSVGARLQRKWVGRAARVLPIDSVLQDIQQKVETAAFIDVEQARSSEVADPALDDARPSVALIRVDEFHLLIITEWPEFNNVMASLPGVAQLGVLQRIDGEIELEDLQGLPWSFWFFLREARKARAENRDM